MEAANDNDDLHPAGDCPSSHGSSQPFVYLIGMHLAAACIQIQQRSRLTGKVAPVGLPRLTGKRKTWMKDAVHADMDLARDAVEKTYSREFQGPNEDFSGTHDDALVTDNFSSITTSYEQEGLTDSGVPSSSLGQASEKTEAQSCTDLTMPTLYSSERQEKIPYISEEMTSEKQTQRAFLQRSLSEQCSLKDQFEGEQNGEASTYSSATFPGRACSSCDDVDVYDNDVTGQAIQEIIVMNKLPNDSQSTTILPNDRFSANLFESRSGPEVMRRSRSVGLELSTPDDDHYETPRNNVHDKDTIYLTKDDLRISDENNTSKTLDFGNELTDRGSQHGQIESLLLWPIGITIQTIAFQIRLIVQVSSLGVRLFSWCNSFASSRVRETMQAKERATEAFSQKLAMISDVRPKVTESGSVVLKRAGWGCVAVLYVCILLGVLLLPTLFLDYVFMSKIVEEPVSFKEPLHFDYTLPHPAAVLSLNSLKSKGISHPERVRPIPVGHKVQVTVFLTLPESDYNRDLGMFQSFHNAVNC
ncbi:hypothetical protein KP509_1Z017600 [Ceratopteris richardii]|nr:hypothetical protein KP509_1Z017600 [Ceratopteris richardii]